MATGPAPITKHEPLEQRFLIQHFSSLASKQDNTGTLAVTAQAPGQAWGRWAEQHNPQPIETFYAMDISGIIQSSYDHRATTSAALSRTLLAPHYIQAQAFSGPASTALVAPHHQMQQQQQQQQHNPFAFSAFTGATPTGLIPAFANNYIQQRPLPRLVQTENDSGRGMPYTRNTGQGYVEEHHSQSPPIKSEPLWNVPTNSPSFASASSKNIASTAPVNGTVEVIFGTEVDTLMKAIQAKSKATPSQISTPTEQSRPVVGVSRTPLYVQAASEGASYTSGEPSKFKLTHGEQHDESSGAKNGKKRYSCTIENCTKSFYQKTHLDIHERAHTGVKPYVSHVYIFARLHLLTG